MGAQDYVTVNGPQAPSYAAPLVGQQLGQTIAGYPDAYMKGRENQRTIALQNAFPNGIPTGPDGSPDVGAITNTMAKIGGGQYVQQMLPFLMQQSQGRQAASDIATAGTSPQSNAAPATGAVANASGPSAVRAQPQTGGPQPTPQGGPQGAPQGQPDNSGQDTLRSIATEVSGGKDITPIIGTAARVMRMNPDAPLSPQDVARVKTFIGNAVRGGPQGASAGSTQPGQPPQGGSQPGLAPGQPVPANGPQVAQSSPQQPSAAPQQPNNGLPPGYTVEAAQNRFQAAQTLMAKSAYAAALKNPELSATYKTAAEALYAQSKQIMDAVQAASAKTPEQKNANDPTVTQSKLVEEQNKNDVERFGKQYESISKIGDQADETIPQLDLAKRLVNDPNFVSGSLAPGSDMMKRLSVAVGMDPNTATPDQLFDKIRAGSILNQIKGMAGTGPVRVAEMKFIDQMIAGRENTPSTLRTLLEIESRLYQRAQAVRDMAHDYHGGHLDTGFDKQVSDFKNKNQLFSKDELKDPRLIAPPTFNNPQELTRAGLKHGDPFKTSDGRIKYVP